MAVNPKSKSSKACIYTEGAEAGAVMKSIKAWEEEEDEEEIV